MLIFLAGGIPGVTPYAGGPHVWGPCLSLFERKPVLVEMKGRTVDEMVQNVKGAIKGGKAHLVGHDLGGLVALTAAYESPDLVSGVSAVAAVPAAPTGDGVPNVTFAHPPQPLFGRESQRWALERASYSHQHIDDALLDGCVAQSRSDTWKKDEGFAPSLMAAKGKFYAACRESGFPVPAQVIWGTHDPLATFDHGLWLYRMIAWKQKAAHFHAVNRAGSLLFREEPAAFHQMVSAFIDGVSP